MSIGLYSRVTDMRFRVAAAVNHGVPLPFSTYGERERNSAKNHLIVTGSRFMAVANSRELVMLKSILVAISFFLVSVAGNADVYVWRSATGVLNYSDTPPPADARDVKILRIPGQKGIGRGTDRAETRQPSPATAGRAGTGSPGSAPGGATTAAASARSSGGAGGAAGGGGAGGAAAGGGAGCAPAGGRPQTQPAQRPRAPRRPRRYHPPPSRRLRPRRPRSFHPLQSLRLRPRQVPLISCLVQASKA